MANALPAIVSAGAAGGCEWAPGMVCRGRGPQRARSPVPGRPPPREPHSHSLASRGLKPGPRRVGDRPGPPATCPADAGELRRTRPRGWPRSIPGAIRPGTARGRAGPSPAAPLNPSEAPNVNEAPIDAGVPCRARSRRPRETRGGAVRPATAAGARTAGRRRGRRRRPQGGSPPPSLGRPVGPSRLAPVRPRRAPGSC